MLQIHHVSCLRLADDDLVCHANPDEICVMIVVLLRASVGWPVRHVCCVPCFPSRAGPVDLPETEQLPSADTVLMLAAGSGPSLLSGCLLHRSCPHRGYRPILKRGNNVLEAVCLNNSMVSGCRPPASGGSRRPRSVQRQPATWVSAATRV